MRYELKQCMWRISSLLLAGFYVRRVQQPRGVVHPVCAFVRLDAESYLYRIFIDLMLWLRFKRAFAHLKLSLYRVHAQALPRISIYVHLVGKSVYVQKHRIRSWLSQRWLLRRICLLRLFLAKFDNYGGLLSGAVNRGELALVERLGLLWRLVVFLISILAQLRLTLLFLG